MALLVTDGRRDFHFEGGVKQPWDQNGPSDPSDHFSYVTNQPFVFFEEWFPWLPSKKGVNGITISFIALGSTAVAPPGAPHGVRHPPRDIRVGRRKGPLEFAHGGKDLEFVSWDVGVSPKSAQHAWISVGPPSDTNQRWAVLQF